MDRRGEKCAEYVECRSFSRRREPAEDRAKYQKTINSGRNTAFGELNFRG